MSKKWKIILAVVVLVIIAVMVFVNLKKSRGTSIDVSLTEVKKGTITKTVSGSGYIQPEVDVQIAARVSSEIMKIYVKEGAVVKKGQLLVRLDSLRYTAFVDQAKSAIQSSKASLKKAQADYVRMKNLFDQNLTTQAELDGAEATKMLYQSDLEQRQAGLKQAQDDLDKTSLISPIAGTVTKLFKEEGEIAVGSQFQADPIMTVSDLSKMEVLAEIDENDVVLVSLNDETTIEIDAIPDTTFKGIVSEIAHEATTRGRGTQEQVTNFEVKIAVTTDVEMLRPGMSATIDISTETHEDVLFVPIQCVTMRSVAEKDTSKAEADSTEKKTDKKSDKKAAPKGPKKEVVFVVENDMAKVVPVETGISDDTRIEILSGLEEGQKVVSGSYKVLSETLKDESKVKEKEGKGAPGEGSGN
jgi:HlyD family secretion protein